MFTYRPAQSTNTRHTRSILAGKRPIDFPLRGVETTNPFNDVAERWHTPAPWWPRQVSLPVLGTPALSFVSTDVTSRHVAGNLTGIMTDQLLRLCTGVIGSSCKNDFQKLFRLRALNVSAASCCVSRISFKLCAASPLNSD